jgi:hypothetical protein
VSVCLNVVVNSCIAVAIRLLHLLFCFFVFGPDFWAVALDSFCRYMLLGGGGVETKSSSWRVSDGGEASEVEEFGR